MRHATLVLVLDVCYMLLATTVDVLDDGLPPVDVRGAWARAVVQHRAPPMAQQAPQLLPFQEPPGLAHGGAPPLADPGALGLALQSFASPQTGVGFWSSWP